MKEESGEKDYFSVKQPRRNKYPKSRLDKNKALVRANWVKARRNINAEVRKEVFEGDKALTHTIAGLLNALGEEITDYDETKWNSKNTADYITAIEKRFEILYNEATLRNESINKDFNDYLGSKTIDDFYTQIKNAVFRIEESRLNRKKSKRKR